VSRLLIVGSDGAEIPGELSERLSYYAPGISAVIREAPTFGDMLSLDPVIVAQQDAYERPDIRSLVLIRKLICDLPSVFNVDAARNPMDGWEWCALTRYLSYGRTRTLEDLPRAQTSFRNAIGAMRQQSLRASYIFGTGASLERAGDRDWSDGYRIVCNTIVRDAALWRHIDPHIIVAGDAIYHFGHTAFARAFRRDLEARLLESDTLFVYPASFDCVVRTQLTSEIHARCIPVALSGRKRIHSDLSQTFELPAFGNVLLLLLLPLACTLSRDVRLWGFDGRAPTDKYFWTNSSRHTYGEHFNTLIEAHPAFFDHYVPKSDPNKYVRTVHGDVLETALQAAESEGWTFQMLHQSWTEALAKRLKPT
jgi:hypothetical protein